MKMPSTGRFTPLLRRMVHYGHSKCSECGKPFPTEVAAYAGYTPEGSEVYVGDCCAAKVDELASHIYWWWASYKRPTPETRLLRFMDFSKLVAILTDKTLFFARADTLGDPFEGARGIASRKPEWAEYTLNYLKETVRTPPPGFDAPPEEIVEKEARRLQEEIEEGGRRDIRNTFVSCWHANEGESEALWRLYCPPGTAGVCIATTFASLDTSLICDEEIRFGHVQYIDFTRQFAGTYDRIFWKRKSLSHEAEVRGVIERRRFNQDDPSMGIPVKVDAAKMIQQLIVSPFAPPWFDAVLLKTIASFGLSVPVVQSELAEQPFF